MTGNEIRNRNMAITSGGYVKDSSKQPAERGKLSCVAAMILGALCTLELMVAGAMVFNIDIRSVDLLAVIFAFLVLFFGVVAVLTDN